MVENQFNPWKKILFAGFIYKGWEYILYLQTNRNMSSKTKKMRMNWEVPASRMSHQTFNPIRNIVDTMKLTPNPEKEMIALSIGKVYIT